VELYSPTRNGTWKSSPYLTRNEISTTGKDVFSAPEYQTAASRCSTLKSLRNNTFQSNYSQILINVEQLTIASKRPDLLTLPPKPRLLDQLSGCLRKLMRRRRS
jgi:hypothetical protein